MQVSSVNLFKTQNLQAVNSDNRNYYSVPKGMQADSFVRTSKTANKAPIFTQSANSMSLITFGGLAKATEIIKPAIQMRVQGVKNFQHNMDPERLRQGGMYAINKLANGPWMDGQKLTYSLDRKVIKLYSPEVGEIGRVPAAVTPFIMGLLQDEPNNYEFELSNVIAGNTKGASTIGLRVNLLYKGDRPEGAFQACDEILNDPEASKKAFFYQDAATPREILKEILKFEEKDNGVEAAKTMEHAVDTIVKELENPENKKILFIGHCKPDGDTLGCILGMKNSMEAAYPDRKIDCAVDDEVTGLFRHKLPGIDNAVKHPYSAEKVALLEEQLRNAEAKGSSEATLNGIRTSLEKAVNPDLLLDKNEKYDLVVLMDIPTPTRFSSGFKNYIQDAKKAIYIDHHPYKEEEWEKAKDTTGVDMKKIFNNSLGWVAERVPAATQQAAIIASKLGAKNNLFNPDNVVRTMNSVNTDRNKLNAAVAAFVTGIWTDTGGFSRTANLIPEDIIDKKGERVPISNRPNFLPEGMAKWMMGLTNGDIDKKWMRDNITYDINDEKSSADALATTAREKMIEIANAYKYENKGVGLGIVNATYEQMQEVLELAQANEPETGLLDVQNSFKYSEVMGNFRSSIAQNGSADDDDTQNSQPGPYDEDKIAVFICESERKGDLNTEGKKSTTDALRFSFRSVEGTTHAELIASLFNGGGHGGAAGGHLKGDGIRIDTPLAVQINGRKITNGELIYKTLKQNYDVMHDSKLSAAQKAAKRVKVELVPDMEGETSAQIIEKLVHEIRSHEPKIMS